MHKKAERLGDIDSSIETKILTWDLESKIANFESLEGFSRNFARNNLAENPNNELRQNRIKALEKSVEKYTLGKISGPKGTSI